MLKQWLAVVAVVTACGITAARADYQSRIVGSWVTNAKEDRFGDGGAYSAFVMDGNYALGVRCLQKRLSLAVLLVDGDPKPLREGDSFEFKFRVDQEPVVETKGLAISSRLIQIQTEKSLVKSIRSGRETAIRLKESNGVASTHIFKTSGGGKAFSDLAKECPLD